ncbi:MAG: GldG family protein [Oscillospiraceae bacterium]|nr:GldG family protein [Oscillospiraceae bacterium]
MNKVKGALRAIVRFFGNKRFKYGTLSVVMTAAFVAVVVLVNILGSMALSRVGTSIDTSAERIFSILPETAEYLSELEDSVTITVASREHEFVTLGISEFYNQTNEILKRFAESGNHVTLEYVDILTNPEFASNYDDDLGKDWVIIRSGNTERERILKSKDYLNATYYDTRTGAQISENEYQLMAQMGAGMYVQRDVSTMAESAFLSAVMSVTSTEPVRVAFTANHGESRQQQMEALLSLNAYTVEYIDLVMQEIDNELDILIMNAPNADLSKEVLNKISKWLNNDGMFGKEFFYFAHSTAETPRLDKFLSNEWGITPERAYVVQRDSRYASPISITGLPMDVQYFQPHDYFSALNDSYNIFGDNMRYVNADWETKSVGIQTVMRTRTLLSSNFGAYVVPFGESIDTYDYSAAESGSFPIAVRSSMERHLTDGDFDMLESSVTVFGGTNVFLGAFMVRPGTNNAAFFLAMMNDVSGKDDDVPVIAPKSIKVPMFEISAGQAEALGVTFALVIPFILIVTGVVVWVRRIRS